ncbi:hypothetical protein BC831DRAFT_10166 [Entophlyctis helioformis]|nr:hypothetical protein BC831DRAFT_10166 [Entophlyctis helioformis]
MANDGLQDKEHRQRQQKQQQQHQQHQQQQQCIPTSQATSQYGRLGSDHRPSHSQPSLSPLLSTLRLLQTPQSQHSSPAPQQQQQPAHRTLKRLHLPRLPVPAASDAGLAETLSIRRALSFDLLGGRSNSTSQPSDTQSLRSALQRRHSETVKHHSNRDLDHARPSPVSRRPSFPLRLVPVQSPTSSSASPRTIKPTNSNSTDQDTSVIEQPATDDPDRTVAESSVQHPSNLKSCSATHALEISFEYITDERVHRKTASTRKPLPRIGGPTLAPASIFPASNSAISSTSSLLPPPPLLPLSALLVCPPHLRPLLPVGPVSSSVHPAFLQRALILAARAAQSQEHKQELATALQPHGTRPHQTHTTASPVAAVACSDIDLRPRSCDRESATTASGSRPGSSESTAASMSFPNRYSQRPSNAGVGVGTSMRSPGSIANQAALLASSSLGPRSISRMSYRSDRSDSTHLGGGGGGGAPSYISITSSSLLGAQDTLSPSPVLVWSGRST